METCVPVTPQAEQTLGGSWHTHYHTLVLSKKGQLDPELGKKFLDDVQMEEEEEGAGESRATEAVGNFEMREAERPAQEPEPEPPTGGHHAAHPGTMV